MGNDNISLLVLFTEDLYGQVPAPLDRSVSTATATLVQTSASTMCIASQSPCVINFGASTHMTDTSSVLSDISPVSRPSRVTLVDVDLLLMILLVLLPLVCVLFPYCIFYVFLNLHLIFYLSINLLGL